MKPTLFSKRELTSVVMKTAMLFILFWILAANVEGKLSYLQPLKYFKKIFAIFFDNSIIGSYYKIKLSF